MSRINSYMLNALVIIYAFYDVLSSASAGNSNSSRTQVYIVLFAIILLMQLSVIANRYLRFDSFTKLLLLYSLYYTIDEFLIKGNLSWYTISHLALSIWWLLTVIYFRDAQNKDNCIYSRYKIFGLLMFIVYIIVVLYGSWNIRATYRVSYARVGYVYHVLSLLPLVLLVQTKRIKGFLIGLACVVTIFSFKRGAIIILPITLLTYFIVENKTGHGKNNILRFVGAALAFSIGWIIIDRYSGGYLRYRFTRDELVDGSGRSYLISNSLGNISQRNIIQFLFGIKASTEHTSSLGAHNEWIAQIENGGLIGTIIYAMIIAWLIIHAIKLVKDKSILAASFSAMTIYSVGIGLVSGWYFMHATFYIMLFLGLVISLEQNRDEDISRILTMRRGKTS